MKEVKYTIALKLSYAKRNPDIEEEFPMFDSKEEAQVFIESNGIEMDYYRIKKVNTL